MSPANMRTQETIPSVMIQALNKDQESNQFREIKKSEDNRDCFICFEKVDFYNFAMRACGHVHCSTCIRNRQVINVTTCPVDKKTTLPLALHSDIIEKNKESLKSTPYMKMSTRQCIDGNISLLSACLDKNHQDLYNKHDVYVEANGTMLHITSSLLNLAAMVEKPGNKEIVDCIISKFNNYNNATGIEEQEQYKKMYNWLNNKDSMGNTVLHTIANNGNIEIYNTIHDELKALDFIKDESVFIKNKQNVSPFQLAVKNKNFELADLMAQTLCKKSKPIDRLLHIAEQNNDAKLAKFIIENHPDMQGYSDTPLNFLLQHRASDSLIKKIIDLEPDKINWYDSAYTKKPPLDFALSSNRHDIALYLLQKNANPHFINSNGLPALHLALHKRYTDIVELLIEKGVDINIEDNNGNTPLITALDTNNYTIASLLIKKGADVYKKNRKKETAFSKAEAKGFDDILNIISNSQPLIFAIKNDEFLAINSLLKVGSSKLTTTDKQGNTALHLAVIYKKQDLIQKFIQHDENIVTMKNSDGETAFMIAAKNGDIDSVELIKKLAEDKFNDMIDEADNSGYTPIYQVTMKFYPHYAIEYAKATLEWADANIDNNPYLSIFDILNKAGAKTYLEDKYHYNLLGIALKFLNYPVAKKLICTEANINHVSSSKQNILHILMDSFYKDNYQNKDKKDLTKYDSDMVAFSENNSKEFIKKIRSEYLELLSQVLEHRYFKGINDVNSSKLTPLMIATQCGDNKVILQLIDGFNAKVGMTNNSGNNELHLYSCNQYPLPEIINKLIEHGCDLKAKNVSGDTAAYELLLKSNLTAKFQPLLYNNKDCIVNLNLLTNKLTINTNISQEALLTVVKSGDTEVLAGMLEKSSTVKIKEIINQPDSNGITPIQYAMINWAKTYLQYINRIITSPILDEVHFDRHNQYTDIFNILVKHGANINQNQQYNTENPRDLTKLPLIDLAIETYNYDAVKKLLDMNVKLNPYNTIKLIIQKTKNLGADDIHDGYELYERVFTKTESRVILQLQRVESFCTIQHANLMPLLTRLLKTDNLDLNQKDSEGDTLLLSLAKKEINDPIILKQLINAGANPEIVDYENKTIWHILFCYANSEDINTRIYSLEYVRATSNNNLTILQKKDNNGNTPIHILLYTLKEGNYSTYVRKYLPFIYMLHELEILGFNFNIANKNRETIINLINSIPKLKYILDQCRGIDDYRSVLIE